MTDHTAIIERAVTAYVSTLNSQPEDERNALAAMEAALTASGLLEVLKKAEGINAITRTLPTHELMDGEEREVWHDLTRDLDSAIERVRGSGKRELVIGAPKDGDNLEDRVKYLERVVLDLSLTLKDKR